MIAELNEGEKFVRFEWTDGTYFVNIQDFNTDRGEHCTSNTNESLEHAREIWEILIRMGYKRINCDAWDPNLIALTKGCGS